MFILCLCKCFLHFHILSLSGVILLFHYTDIYEVLFNLRGRPSQFLEMIQCLITSAQFTIRIYVLFRHLNVAQYLFSRLTLKTHVYGITGDTCCLTIYLVTFMFNPYRRLHVSYHSQGTLKDFCTRASVYMNNHLSENV